MNVVHDQSSSGADARLSVRDNRDQLLARADLWWNDVPARPDDVVGCLGAFEASDPNSAAVLLEAALARLREAGCTLAIGPMDGNTWRNHRFVIEDHGDPPFFREPRNPPEYPAYFVAAGFRQLSSYSSSLLPLGGQSPDLSRALRRIESRGIILRNLQADRFHRELTAIHQVCLASFSQNFLYTPVSRDEFVTSYAKVGPLVEPSLVRIAERDGEMIGFLFALPDPASQGGRLILKTLAVHPRHRTGGLGSILVAQVQQRAREAGFTAAIHALQHDSNSSRRITTRHQSRVIRRYALYACPLRR